MKLVIFLTFFAITSGFSLFGFLPQIPQPPIVPDPFQLIKLPTVPTLPNFNPFANLIPGQISNFNATPNFLQQLFNNRFTEIRQNSFGSAPQPLIDILEAAFGNFQKIVNETLAQGIENVENSINSLNSTAQVTIASVKNFTTQSVEKLDEKIQKYNGTIRECIANNASAYREIIPAAVNQSVECVNYKVQNGVEIVEKGREDIAAAVAGASNLSSALQECSSNYKLGCYLSAIVNIRNDTILLPLQLTRRFSEMVAYVSSTSADVAKCAVIVSQTITIQSINVTQTITNCVFGNQ
jgi:hypothetical protein